MRMFAYHLCESPLVERTAEIVRVRRVSVGGPFSGVVVSPLLELRLRVPRRAFRGEIQSGVHVEPE